MDPRTLHDHQDDVTIVDVREPDEWHAGRIPGAHWVQMDELPHRLDEFDHDHRRVMVCRSGNRSDQMARFLRERGFDAENLEGGIQAWSEQGLPVLTPDGDQPGRVA